ncbi:MAG TPA: TetR/AcrR family transcriptional regulator [Acidimicrobiales bacterium]|nr:TetR/AcrR family transcriptional regulator [Acidimicrobiales bacterium]
MGRVKGLRPEDTRRRVVDGAADAFAALGYEGARVTDIATAAGLSSGAMYNHFGSKAELLAAVVESHACNHLGDWFDTGAATSVLDMIRSYGTQLGSGSQPAAPLLIEAASTARRDPEVLAVLSEQVTIREAVFAEALAEAQANGEIAEEVDARAAARFMFMVLMGSALVQAMELPVPAPASWESLMERVVDAFRPEEEPRP